MDPPGDPDTHLRLRTTDLCPTRAGGAPLNGWVGMNANLSLSNKQSPWVVPYTSVVLGVSLESSDQIRSVAQSCPTLGLNPCFPLTIFFFYLKSCQVLNFLKFIF